MNIDTIAKIEHFSAFVDLSLQDFCEQFRQVLKLPQMTFDNENETEWAEVNFNGINYNVSKPFEIGTLNNWDDLVPENHNFGIVLSINKSNTEFKKPELEEMASLLSNHFNVDILYYRTWFSTGFNTEKAQIFTSKN